MLIGQNVYRQVTNILLTATVVALLKGQTGNTDLTSLSYFLRSATISSVQSIFMSTSGLCDTEVTFTLSLE